MNAIEIKNLTKYYGKARGVLDLNLTVEEGEFFGFIGPNGAGKSTTIRTLLGLIHPTSGSGTIFGMDIEKEKKKILADVGYLPSEAIFYSGMRVKDVLKLSADLRKKDCREESAGLCERLQLDTSRKVDELSKTSTKRVMVHGEVSLEGFSGVRDQQLTEDGTSFLYSGDLNALIQCLSKGRLIDLSLSEPDLEEIFMHYYTDGGEIK